jgi:MoaD family protein
MTRVQVHFYSYFKDQTGCERLLEEMPPGSTIDDLLSRLFERYPPLARFSKSMLVAVGVEYQDRGYLLRDGDEVSLFPPVQGG